MKNFTKYTASYIIIIICNLFFGNINYFNTALAAEYCIPPKYYSGPFTGIVSFSLGSLNNTTEFSDGYRDFSAETPAIDLIIGSTDTVSMDLYYDPLMLNYFAGNLNVRVWADWNGDFDFVDEGEEVVAELQNCSGSTNSNPNIKFTAVFTVPATAKSGLTRLRVYEDMAETDGHITPNPCGYLESPNELGQHGECEDYAVNIINSTTIVANPKEIDLNYFPNPTSDWLIINLNKQAEDVNINLYNVLGIRVYSNHYINANNFEIYMNDYESGFYALRVKTNEIEKFLKIIKE